MTRSGVCWLVFIVSSVSWTIADVFFLRLDDNTFGLVLFAICAVGATAISWATLREQS